MLANKLSVLPENNVVRPALLFIGSFRYELWGMHDDNIGIKLGDSRNMSYGGSSKVLLSFFFYSVMFISSSMFEFFVCSLVIL